MPAQEPIGGKGNWGLLFYRGVDSQRIADSAQLATYPRQRMLRDFGVKLFVIERNAVVEDEFIALNSAGAVSERFGDEQCFAHTGSTLLLTLHLDDKTEIAEWDGEGTDVHGGARLSVERFADDPNARHTIEQEHAALDTLHGIGQESVIIFSQFGNGCGMSRQIRWFLEKIKADAAAFGEIPNSPALMLPLIGVTGRIELDGVKRGDGFFKSVEYPHASH